MKNHFFIGFSISVFNLLFYAVAFDLFFHSGIFLKLFQFDLLKFCGDASTIVGIISVANAILLEVISYRVIRRGASSS
jgi:hypothetical protein